MFQYWKIINKIGDNMILVTGGAGFIGLNFVKHLLKLNEDVVVVDNLTYASNPNVLMSLKVKHECVDIVDNVALTSTLDNYSFTKIYHFAAESHVDNSINDVMPFVNSNIIGTINLLNYFKNKDVKFIQVSTDEVFGEVPYPGKFNEYSNIVPRNPYSASKASAEHFVNAYKNSYKMNTVIVNSSNNYGPYQHIEKMIPKTITNIIQNKNIPVYGQGLQIRDWIYVEDTCEAIYKISMLDNNIDRYCIGADYEIKNIDLVKRIVLMMDASTDLISYVNDRPGHDMRYSTEIIQLLRDTDWRVTHSLDVGLQKTIEWYKNENRI
jgi:dTDP-glucose 4,6-dehydratase